MSGSLRIMRFGGGRIWKAAVILAVGLMLIGGWRGDGRAREFRTIDPSGVWKNENGELALMLSGDALSFSYTSVFGAAAHICDGAGVAGLDGDNEYHQIDEQGVVAFQIRDDQVSMRLIRGIASFCGADWPGEVFTRQGYTPPGKCRVSAAKSYFHVVMPMPPEQRKAYAVKGDVLDTVPAHHEGGKGWVIARLNGPKATTVGLFRKDLLECLK